MIRSTTLTALLLGVLSAAPVSAQLMGARELTTVGAVKGAPKGKAGPDMYYLAGETGAKETYTLNIKGPASVTLFTPDGHEMLSAGGSGKVTLTAYLPLTDVFTLAVSRLTPGQAYTLSRTTTVPTLAEAQSFSNIGYTFKGFIQCWITPGVKYRVTMGTRIGESTLAADRATVSVVAREGSKNWSYERTYSLAGDVLTSHTRLPSGKVVEHQSDFHMFSLADGHARQFSGYLCAD